MGFLAEKHLDGKSAHWETTDCKAFWLESVQLGKAVFRKVFIWGFLANLIENIII